MCLFHSVAIKVEMDFLDVLGLNQLAISFPDEDASKTLLVCINRLRGRPFDSWGGGGEGGYVFLVKKRLFSK